MTNKENFYFAGKCLTLNEHPEFRGEIIQAIESNSVNWKDFICLCNNHLILPLIYLKFKAHDLLASLPKELSEFLNEIYAQYVPQENLAILSGPSFASEVLQSLPTALVINSHSVKTADALTQLFPKFIRTYVSDDVIGAEIAGAYKNVIAIATGICEGLGLGKNAAASLISRGLVEMQRFGKVYGAQEETFLGLSGAGDLFLTASSNMSRNYRVGLGLASGKSKEAVCEEIGEVSEGIGTAYALHEIAAQKSIYLPIAAEVYAVLEGKPPHESFKDLLKR